ncbi:MAG: asparaginyl/glutamyl-tRNA amidotransferase subunit C [Elusimicrobia bacterium RIFOXYA2_FULL_40_6]|nr:MAG: asparaginyl/glutamyl-tRNA amidotransferase subunit C [Elusimicrobia bacterium RIFOXYA2_FULL_40_6]
MKITQKDVEYVANLARLEFSEDEKKTLTLQLERILGYMDKLNEVNTSDILPTASVVDLKNIFREDIVENFKNTDGIIANAPEREERFFKVKKIIE